MSDKEIEDWVNKDFANLSEGCYNIGDGVFVCHTGRLGKINFEIVVRKMLRDRINNS